MSEYKFLGPDDAALVEQIIAQSDEILVHNPALRAMLLEDGDAAPHSIDQQRLGVSDFCMEASDAVTRAAHSLGIVAAREFLAGWHGITYFGPLDRLPRKDDLVLCRTWGQYDAALYTSNHPRAQRPFFGTRQEMAELLPDTQGRFEPDAVTYRQVAHRPKEFSPRGRHGWLAITPEELVTARFTLGITDLRTTEDATWL